jgi:hypothetical protein
MGGVCGTYGWEEGLIEGFGRETWKEEATWKI